ncbi:MAG TPA: DUF6491 family protein [Gammaproteobacteria bacterium]|nr:DUF6491 family protein [Gammaproteobacteria bacterium]
MPSRDRLLTLVAATAVIAPLTVQADDKKNEDFDRAPVDCIIVKNIDRTDIIDDRTIVFVMRGKKKIYVNNLPSNCPNLESSDRFGYAVTSSRLCKVDLIQALPRVGIPIPCRIGEFVPISTEEVEELHAIHDQGRKSDKIDVKPVNPSNGDAAGSDGAPKGAEPRR